jgi:hypothetical protein
VSALCPPGTWLFIDTPAGWELLRRCKTSTMAVRDFKHCLIENAGAATDRFRLMTNVRH